MRAVDIIRKKRDGHALDAAEIDAFVQGVTARTWRDYQASALLMAIVWRGMNPAETTQLARAMATSGAKLDLSAIPGPKVDKHSTGGVGDKASLIVVPLAAACGLVVPKMSGRGLGHSGGTLDKLEAIPGYRVALSLDEIRAVLSDIGCVIAGQTSDLAPADKLLYGLRDVTATVESIPLITASILSKKIAEGIDALVLDVKCGVGAFMKNAGDARALAESLAKTGQANGVRTEALVTAMESPLGRAVGNALEVKESLETLRGNGPKDLEELAVTLAARMLVLGKVTRTVGEAEQRVRHALSSGHGLEKFRAIIARQGGDPRVVEEPNLLPRAPHTSPLRAPRAGFVTNIHAELVGRAAVLLGAGRDRVEDAIDPAVGVVVRARIGERVHEGETLAEIHYRDEMRLDWARPLLEHAWKIADWEVPPVPLIWETIP